MKSILLMKSEEFATKMATLSHKIKSDLTHLVLKDFKENEAAFIVIEKLKLTMEKLKEINKNSEH